MYIYNSALAGAHVGPKLAKTKVYLHSESYSLTPQWWGSWSMHHGYTTNKIWHDIKYTRLVKCETSDTKTRHSQTNAQTYIIFLGVMVVSPDPLPCSLCINVLVKKVYIYSSCLAYCTHAFWRKYYIYIFSKFIPHPLSLVHSRRVTVCVSKYRRTGSRLYNDNKTEGNTLMGYIIDGLYQMT